MKSKNLQIIGGAWAKRRHCEAQSAVAIQRVFLGKIRRIKPCGESQAAAQPAKAGGANRNNPVAGGYYPPLPNANPMPWRGLAVKPSLRSAVGSQFCNTTQFEEEMSS